MLSKKVKERIRKNKQRRFQCRTKAGRFFWRFSALMVSRTAERSFNKWIQDHLLKPMTVEELIPTGFKHFDGLIQGGFKRGELPILYARAVPYHERRTDFTSYMIGQAAKPMPDFVLGLDPGVKEGDRTVTIAYGKRRTTNNIGSLFDVNLDFKTVRLGEIDKAGNVEAEVFKQEVQDRMALHAQAAIAPRMYRKPDGSLEVLSYDIVAEPGRSPPMPSELNGVQPLMPEASAALWDTLSKFKEVDVSAIVQGVKDGTIPSVTIDSFSDFGESHENRP